ncbi:hypothetical protein [Eggerthella guodeyinii]|uniref:Uncharacterized protein n=1 Tax=Eggerthella guodeyinii TaxID=2690837 RepID=A0A6N7RT17_9ACTN|nr:hypothetical protein [Eggerthella guodeyinii]MRX83950.1 hypothetical protein [Eggerthella guodeyinii]
MKDNDGVIFDKLLRSFSKHELRKSRPPNWKYYSLIYGFRDKRSSLSNPPQGLFEICNKKGYVFACVKKEDILENEREEFSEEKSRIYILEDFHSNEKGVPILYAGQTKDMEDTADRHLSEKRGSKKDFDRAVIFLSNNVELTDGDRFAFEKAAICLADVYTASGACIAINTVKNPSGAGHVEDNAPRSLNYFQALSIMKGLHCLIEAQLNQSLPWDEAAVFQAIVRKGLKQRAENLYKTGLLFLVFKTWWMVFKCEHDDQFNNSINSRTHWKTLCVFLFFLLIASYCIIALMQSVQ